MNEWDLPVEVIMQQMTEGKEELAKSTGDLILFRDRRFLSGSVSAQIRCTTRTVWFFTRIYFLSNIPYPL